MMITKKALDRRMFMRGVGATLALPLLDAMIPSLTAASRTAASPVTRLGFLYVPNGILGPAFWPTTEGPNFEITQILGPLADLRHEITIIGGLSNAQADSMGVGGGPHTRCGAAWLSGARAKRTEGADIELGTTIDQYAAQVLGEETPLRSLELALDPTSRVGNCDNGYSCAYLNSMSWRTPRMPLPGENNPRVVFERLFGEGATGAERLARTHARRSVLDAVAGDLARLQRQLGPRDVVTVDEYLDSVREVERRLEKAEQYGSDQPLPLEKPGGVPKQFEEHAKLMFDLQFLAYRADITRVVSYQLTRELSPRAYPKIGVSEGHHGVSHHANNPEKMAGYAKICAYHMGLFAGFLEKLRATPDGDGSLLDHSLLVYGSGMGDGDLHSPHDLQVVLAGRGCGTVTSGRYVRYTRDTPMMNLGLSLLDKVGVTLDKIGDSTGRLTDL